MGEPLQLEIAAVATEIVYKVQVVGNAYPELPGFRVDRVFDDLWDNTGFYAVGFANAESGDVLIAIRGSEDRWDIVTDAGLGVSQYLANRVPLVDYIGQNILAGSITIAGHSLGGGLSQYLGYDAALAYPGFRDRITVHTHNGFGGIVGIAKMHGRFDPAVVEGVTFRNYRHPDDPVSRIGGHLGGIFNLVDPDPLLDGLVYAHSNQRFMRAGDRLPLTEAVAAEDDAFDITQTLEELGPQLSRALNDIFRDGRPMRAMVRISRLFGLVPERERAQFYALLGEIVPFSRLLRRATARAQDPPGA